MVTSIRRITAEDWRVWRDLRLVALAEAPDAFGASVAEWQDATEQRWRDRLTFHDAANFVAMVDGQPVGMATGIREEAPDTARMISMWVAPAARGTGVADALIEAVRQWARDAGLSLLELDVMVANPRAQAVYVRHGFAMVGDAEKEHPDDPPELRMLTTSDAEQTDRSAIVLAAATSSGLSFEVVRHGPVRSLEEAAAARGVAPSAIVKTMVVRVSDEDHRFVLVPGDREIDWPKLRGVLGVNRVSMPDAESARRVTGFVRGTITPLGSVTALQVIADERVSGTVSLGAGAHGTALTLRAEDLVGVLQATVADVTKRSD